MATRSFAERARRGKKDRLRVFFGEHGTVMGEKLHSKILERHRGIHVAERARWIGPEQARSFLKGIGDTLRDWRKKQPKKSYNAKYANSLLKFLREKRGAIITAEVFSKNEISRLWELSEKAEAHENALYSSFEKSFSSGLENFNGLINVQAQRDIIREKAIIRNLSKAKGNVLARYGTTHSTMFPELRAVRPDAKIIRENRIRPYDEQLTIMKKIGKALNPQRAFLVKAYLSLIIDEPSFEIYEKLRVSLDNPRISLFMNALIDNVPRKKREKIITESVARLKRIKKIMGLTEDSARESNGLWVLDSLLRENGFTNCFGLVKMPDSELNKAMKEFSIKVYGKKSLLYQTAYGIS